MVGDDVAASADGVAGCAVGAEDACVAVEAGEVLGAAAVGLLVCAVEDVVGLVGGVHYVSPEEGGADWMVVSMGV